jgi:hypothetical protein
MASALVVTLLLVTWSTAPQAQDLQIYKDQVVRFLRGSTKIQYYTTRNFAPLGDGITTGYIRVGANPYQDVAYRLEAGYVYAFVGACDEDCRDIDLTLYNPSGAVVLSDTGADDEPNFYVLVTASGTYHLRATIPRCSAPIGCYWGVQAYYK